MEKPASLKPWSPMPPSDKRQLFRKRPIPLVPVLLLLILAVTQVPTRKPKASLASQNVVTSNNGESSRSLSSIARVLQQDQNDTISLAINGTTTIGDDNCTPPVIDDGFCEINCAQQVETSWISAVPFAIQIIMIVFLLCMSALFSGLTLGLMGLDKTGLEIVMSGDDAEAAKAAKIIYPLRKDGNLLLCTLLLGNVAVNSLLSILLADKTGGAVGVLSSTFLIVIFGEIVPQAACSR